MQGIAVIFVIVVFHCMIKVNSTMVIYIINKINFTEEVFDFVSYLEQELEIILNGYLGNLSNIDKK